MKIALAGNPNCGKTTLFNALTGSMQYVGNWPGVTVEKKEGKYRKNKKVTIIDLPGIYSLSPYTLEEVVARNYLLNDAPDVIINLVDATNLERNLYLTTQLMETKIPIVIALNMMDLVNNRNDQINTKELSMRLGVSIVEISALKNFGIEELINQCESATKLSDVTIYNGDLNKAITEVEELIKDNYTEKQVYFTAIKLLENDQEVLKNHKLSKETIAKIDEIRNVVETKFDDDAESIITSARYDFITELKSKTYKKGSNEELTTSDKIDKIVTNRLLALPIFALAMFLVYFIAMSTIGAFGTDWVNEVLFGEWVPEIVTTFLESIKCAPWLIGLIVDGIIAGVGAVLGFVPQIMVLFFCLSFLEDCGYMARVAFIMDRIFRKFGLSGKSFIPMMISTGCGVPGIMATRTIEEEKDRTLTIMLTTFIPCGAKLPIFAFLAGALFGGSALVTTSMYFVGIVTVIICGILLKHTKKFGGEPAPFVMELPAYHWPSLKGMILHMWDRGKEFIKRAGTIILLSSIIVWFLASYNFSFQQVDTDASMLASIGRVIAPIFMPLGWGNWKAAVATISGLIAKENIVGTFGVLYGFEEVADDGMEIWHLMGADFTKVTAYSFMVFNLLCAPCFAAMGAIRREIGSWRKAGKIILFQCVVAYIAALLINVVGRLFF